VVPKALVAAFKQAHYDLNRPGQMPLQAALAEFIEMGHFAGALRKARQAYAERRRALVAALQPVLGQPGGPWLAGAEQGLHLCLRLPPQVDDRALAQEARKHNLIVRPLSAYCIARTDVRGLVMGYGYAPLDSIQRHGPVLTQYIRTGSTAS
jgi:GntR family transcriptional regulator/MocR family aminotransferase